MADRTQQGPWWSAQDVLSEVQALLEKLPDGDNGYESMPETDLELRQATILLENAAICLRRVADLEEARYAKWCSDHEHLLEQVTITIN